MKLKKKARNLYSLNGNQQFKHKKTDDRTWSSVLEYLVTELDFQLTFFGPTES